MKIFKESVLLIFILVSILINIYTLNNSKCSYPHNSQKEINNILIKNSELTIKGFKIIEKNMQRIGWALTDLDYIHDEVDFETGKYKID